MNRAVGNLRPSAERPNGRLIVIVAGEASADLHGANLVRAIRALEPEIAFWGIGGRRMAEAGVRILVPASDMAVVGLTEVLPRARTILRAARTLKDVLTVHRPDLLVLIDYPGFNLHLAAAARKLGVPVLYYIGPQVWAWRRGRVRKIARRVDRMALILPFEASFYRQQGMAVDFVGHPLLDTPLARVDPEAIRSLLGVGPSAPVIALLPGSREEEVRGLLPVMLEAAEALAEQYPGLSCLLALAPTVDPGLVKALLGTRALKVRVVEDRLQEVLAVCRAALAASGTVTLELAIAGLPMVVLYRVSRITYWAARLLVKVPCISLVNLVAGRRVVPELIQDDLTTRRLTEEAARLLEDGRVREVMIRDLEEVREKLGQGGASGKTAAIAMEMIKRNAECEKGRQRA